MTTLNKSLQSFMTDAQRDAYAYAASLAAANEADRAAWIAGVSAQRAAEAKAVEQYKGKVELNRHGKPFGGVHPALAGLTGYMSLRGCYAPA